MPLKVLFLCTENACRSQMAEGLVNHFLAGRVQAFSAGARPTRVNPRAIQVMAELDIDIRHHRAKSVADLAGERFDLVITVCDQAQEECPFFPGTTEKLHVGFPDPARASGTEEQIMTAFRQVRDEIRATLLPLLEEKAEGRTRPKSDPPGSGGGPMPERKGEVKTAAPEEPNQGAPPSGEPGKGPEDRQRPPRSGNIRQHPVIHGFARFLGWWLVFFGVYSSASVCPFCGAPGCPVGAGAAGLVGGFFALAWQYGKSFIRNVRNGLHTVWAGFGRRRQVTGEDQKL
jgi:arsenate reductase